MNIESLACGIINVRVRANVNVAKYMHGLSASVIICFKVLVEGKIEKCSYYRCHRPLCRTGQGLHRDIPRSARSHRSTVSGVAGSRRC